MKQQFLLKAWLTAAVAALALSSMAWADDADEDTAPADDTAELGTVTVIADKMPRPLRDVAGTVTVIDEERLQKELVRNMKDVLRYEPGLSVGNDPNRFGLGSVNIRGVDGNRVLYELDGVPLSDGFSIGSFSDAAGTYPDPEVLKRVEVLRGPASTLYGSDALGGVVTFTTKDPSDYLIAPGDPFYAGLRAGYGSSDNSYFGTVTLATSGERLGGLLVYSIRDGDEFDNNSSEPESPANPRNYDSRSVLAKLTFDHNSGARTRFSVDYAQQGSMTDVQSLVEGSGRFATTTRLDADDEYDRLRISLDQTLAGESWFDDGLWRIYHQTSDSTQRTIEERAATARSPSATQRRRQFNYDQEVVGGEITLSNYFDAEGASYWLVYGLEVAATETAELRDGLLVNLDNGSTSNVIIGEEFPVRDFPITETLEFGAYVQAEIDFARTPLTIIPGLRFDYYNLDPKPDTIFMEDNPDTDVESLSESNLSPKLGLLYTINDRLRLFGQYAQGFRSPPFDDVNIGFTIPLFSFTAIPNPDLRPEKSDGVELGLRYDSGRAHADLTGFYNQYEDLIESRVNLGIDPDTGLLTFQSVNRAKAEIYGIEFRGSVDLDAYDEGIDGVSLRTSIAYARGTDTERDQPLNTVDPLTAVIGLEYSAPSDRWGTALISTLVEKKRRVDDSMVELFKPDGYAVVDLLGYYNFTPSVELTWGIFNLTDKQYWEWTDVKGLTADDPLIDLYARPGRNYSVSLSMQW